MNIMSLDAEYNQPSRKTIQIGAAVFKARTGELLEAIEIYVNPGEPITPFITELTGITDENVVGASSILEAFEQLRLLHKKHKCFKNPLVWGSGTRNDSSQIYEQAYPTSELRELNPNFMGFRVIDAKNIMQSIQLFHNKTIRGGLEATCDRIGIGFEGDPHRALNDAINTFRAWHLLVKNFNGKGF